MKYKLVTFELHFVERKLFSKTSVIVCVCVEGGGGGGGYRGFTWKTRKVIELQYLKNPGLVNEKFVMKSHGKTDVYEEGLTVVANHVEHLGEPSIFRIFA